MQQNNRLRWVYGAGLCTIRQISHRLKNRNPLLRCWTLLDKSGGKLNPFQSVALPESAWPLESVATSAQPESAWPESARAVRLKLQITTPTRPLPQPLLFDRGPTKCIAKLQESRNFTNSSILDFGHLNTLQNGWMKVQNSRERMSKGSGRYARPGPVRNPKISKLDAKLAKLTVANTVGEDGWQAVPRRPARAQFEKVIICA